MSEASNSSSSRRAGPSHETPSPRRREGRGGGAKPSYDAVVIGGGHNGLVCAATLARGGHKVLLAEARDQVGGLAAAIEPAPGFLAPGPLARVQLRPWIHRELSLDVELGTDPITTAVVGGGGRVVIGGTRDAEHQRLAEHDSELADAVLDLRNRMAEYAPVVRAFIDSPAIDLVHLELEPRLALLRRALGLRRLGRRRMMELLRIPPSAARDWLRELLPVVDDGGPADLAAAGLAAPAVAQSYAGPRGPGTAANVLVDLCTETRRVIGGGPKVIRALVAACERLGASIEPGRAAAGLMVENGAVAGVRFEDGTEVRAPRVCCAIDPRSALELIPRGQLPMRTETRIASWRCRGTVAHLAVAVDGDIELGAGRLIAVDGMDDLERAFAAVKYRRCAERPVLEVDRGEAPAGKTALGVRILHVPPEHEGGYPGEVRSALEAAVLERLESAIPALAGNVIATSLRVPPDLEAEIGATGGHLEHGEMALDQMLVRPIPECAGHRGPLPGMVLASSGTHPGGGFTGAPGALAARAAR